ncbi:glucose/sorbosone family PQQ-dependent dehydrogenase [Actinoplanes sp. NPDC049596]|uniref:glucose/sorbosone family PQQ-dependent dehydrogenase n=1 Tax=unclassified Actinoplanes TaxID=2626549 RepID=UPI00342F3463
MKRFVQVFGAVLGLMLGLVPAALPEPPFTTRVVADGLSAPWEVLRGPDGYLWVTERTAGRVLRIDPGSGARTVVGTVPSRAAGTQDGLLGMALDLPYVYLAYTDGPLNVVRYTYAAGRLTDPKDVIVGLPATIDHVSGRLVLGPDGKLYLTVGDGGANQFERACNPNQAQELPASASDFTHYQGKILRINPDGSVPADNPLLAGVRSHVYSFGHRNAQGIVFDPAGRLFSTEQGPKTDDELNLIRAGGNYGWPRVAGYRDDKAYLYANWSAAPDCQKLKFSDYRIPPSVPQQKETSFTGPGFEPPLRTFFTVPGDHDFDGGCGHLCWPTIAPSSVDYYASEAIPQWRGSILIPSLKNGAVYRVDGAGGTQTLWRTVNRYRDLAIGADGRTFFVATDSAGATNDLGGKPTEKLADPGAILEFRAG